jgi:hypothetical protein
MVIYSLMKKTIDLHVHTLVSDGVATPLEMLDAAGEAGLSKLSFCDHDALGAYRHFGDMFAYARGLGIELVPGIELDTDHEGREVHLLGYGFDMNDGPLNQHLNSTQKLRKERVMLQIAVINRFFGRQVIDLKQVLSPLPSLLPTLNSQSPAGTDKLDPLKTSDSLCCFELRASVRDTLMKPHLVHAMLKQGLFSDYRAAAYWVSQNAQVPVEVPKLRLADAIGMVRGGGGEAVLAHPGYLVRENDILLGSLLDELVPLGLSGLEVDYPYLGTSPAFPDHGSELQFYGELRAYAGQFKLKETRGSDAHDTEALRKFAGKANSVTSDK